MSKRKLHHLWVKLKPVHYWYFLAGFIIFGLIFMFSYRQNNVTALKLRDNVLEVDKQNGDIETALKELRAYTYSHMNASLKGGADAIYPPIQLKYRYERLVQAEKDKVVSTNKKVNADAESYCLQQVPTDVYGTRAACVRQYLDSHGAKEQSIPDALYKFDFASPIWSSDLAGWSLIAALIFLFLFILRFALERWLKHSLRE